MRTFRLLKPEEIECRIQQVDKKGEWIQLLLYKTARTDAKLFDETFGPKNWANDYKLIDGKMYCGIGVRADGNQFVWKWNVGTESNTEAEKGQASDALKRAGFVWGCGTELYSSPAIFIHPDACNIKESGGSYTCYDRFFVSDIGYDDDNECINRLEIKNEKTGKVAFTFPAEKAKAKTEPAKKAEAKKPTATPGPAADPAPAPAPAPSNDPSFRCADCGAVLEPYITDKGKHISIRQHANGCMKRFGRYLCLGCIDKVKENG